MKVDSRRLQSRRLRSRRSQITVFVLLGLVILITIALIFYLRSSTIKVKPPVENLEVTDEIKPIQTYVVNCLKENSKEALIKIGQNGGYINVTGMKISPIPYDSDALLFEPQVMPYWYHIRDCQSSSIGCVDSLKPPLCDEEDECIINSKGPNSIEEQLSKYIESTIDRCLDFSIFENLFDIKTGDIDVTTIIRQDFVEFQLSYPIEITSKSSGQKTEIPYFVENHNVKLKEIYELATDITQQEIDHNFLELQTMNLISIYSGVDNKKLPPLSRVELSTNVVTWTRTTVKESIINDVLPYMNFVRIIGAINEWQLMSMDNTDYSMYANGFYNSMEYNLDNKSYDLYANFVYPYSDIYLDFGGSEILKPDEFVPDYPLMKAIGVFIKEYKFKYDITYPLIVSIKDSDAFNGEGYTFNYAMEVNIRKNVPVKGNLSVVDIGGTGSIRMDSLLQRVNRTITVKTKDAHTGEPLDGVYVYYRCGSQYLIGQTEKKNNDASISDRFPFCQFGGQIVYEKTGYMGSAIDYDNAEGNDAKSFTVELWPIVNKNVEVLKRNPTNIQAIRRGGISSFNTQATPLAENETVFISIKREKKNPYDTDIPVVGFLTVTKSGEMQVNTVEEQKQQVNNLYNQGKVTRQVRDELLAELSLLNNSVQVIESFEKIDLVPGKYTIDAFMVYRGNITIPKETRTICAGIKILGVCTNEEEIELPEQHFTTWVNGGAKTNFTITENDIYGSKDKIIFYVLEQPIPVNWVMLENYMSLEDYQRGKEHLVRPRFE